MTQPLLLEPPTAAQADIEAERCVLGAMIMSRSAAEAVIGKVRAEDFYKPTHAALFAKLAELHAKSEPIDSVTLVSTLANTPAPVQGHASYLSWLGGPLVLHSLIESVPTVANATYYADIVTETATRRRLTEAGIRITQMGTQATGLDAGELVDRARSTLDKVVVDPRSKAVDFKMAIARAMGTLGSATAAQGLSTGFRELDKLVGPLRPGMMIVIAGRPGSGKTILATDIARHVALTQGRTALYATWEMSVEEMALRNLCAEAKVRYSRAMQNALDEIDVAKLEIAATRIENAPLVTWDAAGAGLMDIRAEGRRHLHSAQPLGLIVADYLQLVDANSRLSSREQQVAELSRGFKLSAKELGVPIITLAQLNRGPEQRLDKRPQLSDLRESGAVEQDADVVIMVHRPDYYDQRDRPGEVDFMVVKNRHGPTGTVAAAALLHYMKFASFATDIW